MSGLSSRGIIIFEHTSDVIRSETLLKAAGLDVRVKGPPPEIRTGCDLVIEFPLILELEIREILGRNRIKLMKIAPMQDHLLEPVSLFQVKDFGDYLMVRAANMKITVEKSTRWIVNVSGGGCPDVPYLSEQLIGKNLLETSEPRAMGHTLCGYALQLAYEEMKRQWPS